MIIKTKVLGNIQFRQLEGIGTFWGCNRDDIEVIFGTGSGATMDLTVSQDPADVERIKVKWTTEILPGSKVLADISFPCINYEHYESKRA